MSNFVKFNTNMTQRDIVMRELALRGSISKLEMTNLGIGNPMSIIHRLREEGHPISTLRRLDALGRSYPRYVYDR